MNFVVSNFVIVGNQTIAKFLDSSWNHNSITLSLMEWWNSVYELCDMQNICSFATSFPACLFWRRVGNEVAIFHLLLLGTIFRTILSRKSGFHKKFCGPIRVLQEITWAILFSYSMQFILVQSLEEKVPWPWIFFAKAEIWSRPPKYHMEIPEKNPHP